MSDLISRQAAVDDAHRQLWYRMNQQGMKDRIDEWLKNLPAAELDASEWKTDNGYMWLCPSCGLALHSDFDECIRCGNKRPSAEPARKKGKWNLQEDKAKPLYGWHICSECGAYIGEPSKYCSECGADMRTR